jgi:hypothetical protein
VTCFKTYFLAKIRFVCERHFVLCVCARACVQNKLFQVSSDVQQKLKRQYDQVTVLKYKIIVLPEK